MKNGGQRTLLFLCFCSLIACSTSYISEHKKESETKAVLLLPQQSVKEAADKRKSPLATNKEKSPENIVSASAGVLGNSRIPAPFSSPSLVEKAIDSEKLPSGVTLETYDKLIVYKTSPDYFSWDGSCPQETKEDLSLDGVIRSVLNENNETASSFITNDLKKDEKSERASLKEEKYFLQVGSYLAPETARIAFRKMQQYACSLNAYEPFYHRYGNFYRVGVVATKDRLAGLCRELTDLLQGTCVLRSINSISKS